MKVECIAECSLGAFCNTFVLHLAIIDLENQFLVLFLSGRLRQGFAVRTCQLVPNAEYRFTSKPQGAGGGGGGGYS